MPAFTSIRVTLVMARCHATVPAQIALVLMMAAIPSPITSARAPVDARFPSAMSHRAR